ncbi:efflux RND transporter periplasmic adaptor subunit [Candidatus Methylomicrobium oryzae]|uniref:efflux RND transporter periplasmic adaptor subunit n=1 Tax=Candidatus Methylomicrobium oryzae TaxID=2802053 RepID=UPI001921E808|nr:efflux RND transporter periplasmic adaptor subunit [Methylomicrobium sp. RS1]MBL1263964.1 efflux RND transporter periplasmic adaptor subunit [Methylomicrobium sp. RS1]
MIKNTRRPIVLQRNSLPLELSTVLSEGTLFLGRLRIRLGYLAGLAAIAALATAGGCKDAGAPGAQPLQGPSPNVKIARPVSRTVTEWDEYTGRIEAVEAVEVRARVSGYLDKVNFKDGEKVRKGDLLFVIDPRPFKAQLDYASAELERVKSRKELAANDLERAERLFKVKAISKEEYDARQKGLREASAVVASAAANVETARLNLEYTQIRAPIDGRISRELITVGNLVKTDDTLLTTIVSTNPVYVYVDADERAVLKYRRKNGRTAVGIEGTPVELALADENDFPHRGMLDYIAPREDTATGTITLRGVFPNDDDFLRPGFFARLRVRLGEPYPALLIPDQAIGTDQANRFVWVANPNNEVEYRTVELGAHIGQLRVIRKGLKPEDWVVIEGLQKLRPGLKVTPEKISLAETQPGQ